MNAVTKALLKKQWLEFFGGSRQGSRDESVEKRTKRSVGSLLFSFLLFACLYYTVAGQMAKSLLPSGQGALYFAIMGLTAAVFSVFGGAFAAYSTLYEGRDNDLLLSLPIHPRQILFARTLRCYFISFLFTSMVLVPSDIAALVHGLHTGSSVVIGLLSLFILPVFALAFACIFGWLIALGAAHTRDNLRSLFVTLFSLVLMGGYLALFFEANHIIQGVLQHPAEVQNAFHTGLFPFWLFGQSAVGRWLPFLLFLLLTAVFFALIYLVLSASFIRLATMRKSGRHAAYRAKKMKSVPVRRALLRRERIHLFRTPVYLLNCAFGSVLLLAGFVFLLFRGRRTTAELTGALGDYAFAAPLIYLGIICVLAISNNLTAPSVSLEGQYLWQLRSLPAAGKDILDAKMHLHLLMTLVPAELCVVEVIVLSHPGALTAVFMLVYPAVLVYLNAAFGLLRGLRAPRLNWENEATVIKQDFGLMFPVMFSEFALALTAGLFFAVRHVMGSGAFLVLATALFCIPDFFLRKKLQTKGVKLWEAVE